MPVDTVHVNGRALTYLGRPVRLLRTLSRIGPTQFVRTGLQRLRQEALTRSVRSIFIRSDSTLSGRALARAIENGEFGQSQILSARFDAFGGRLWNLLNAMRVADALGAQVRFYWPMRPLDGIGPAEEVFAAGFLHEHRVEAVDLPSLRNVRTWTDEDLAHLRGSSEMVWYEAKHRDPAFNKFDIATRGFRFKRIPTYQDAFASLRLHPALECVREAVEGLDRFPVGVHARRGDVYRGDFRLGGQGARKAIPLPIVELLLERAPGDGSTVLISNDAARIRDRLRVDAERVLIASEVLDAAGSELEQMFLDFCLFTRCDEVFAGTSVFAIIPTHIGGGRAVPPDDVLNPATIRVAVTEFVEREAGHPDLEVALACTYLQDRFRAELSEQERDHLLGVAVKADPENPGLLVAQAARHFRRGRDALAEELFERARTSGAPEYAIRLTEHSLDISRGVGFAAIDGSFLDPRDWDTIEDHSDGGPWAAFYLGLRCLALGDRERAASLLDVAMHLPENAAPAAARELLAQSEGLTPAASGQGLSNAPGVDEGF